MSILWIAIWLYIIGISAVLYFRPPSMFHSENGVWKEFGLGGGELRTVFPFWLFTITWAILSYALATMITLFMNTTLNTAMNNTLNMNASMDNFNSIAHPISTMGPSLPPPSLPLPSLTPSIPAPTLTQPGYYVLQPPIANEMPRYVYYGTTPPTS